MIYVIFRIWVLCLLLFFTLVNFLHVYYSEGCFDSNEFFKWEFSTLVSISVLVVSYTVLRKFEISENDRKLISAILAMVTYTSIVPPYLREWDFRLWSGAFWCAVLAIHLLYMKYRKKQTHRDADS